MEIQNNSIFFLLTLKRQLEDSLCYFCDAIEKKMENDEIIKDSEWDIEFMNVVKDIYKDYCDNNDNLYIQNQIYKIKDNIIKIDDKLYSICNHEFVEEDVETVFEKNLKIKYCMNCSLDFRNETCININL